MVLGISSWEDLDSLQCARGASLITIIEACTTLAGTDPTGPITGGYIDLSGHIRRCISGEHGHLLSGNWYDDASYEVQELWELDLFLLPVGHLKPWTYYSEKGEYNGPAEILDLVLKAVSVDDDVYE